MQIPAPYEDEFAFFEAAQSSEAVYLAYRQRIEGIAEEEVERVSSDPALRAHLIAAAMEPYDRAFRHYAKRERTTSPSYPFSTYFRWWARQYASTAYHGLDRHP